MIWLSILAKTYALVLWNDHLVAAAVCWTLGGIADARGMRGPRPGIRSVLLLNLAAWLVGQAGLQAFAAISPHWKSGIPALSHALGLMLRCLQLPATASGGDLYLSTMAGPLRFPISIDRLGLLVPICLTAISVTYLLWMSDSHRDVLRRLVCIVALLLGVTLLRMAASIVLFLSLCDFVSYETEELPLAPFVRPLAVALSYLPFLVAAWPLQSRALAGLAPGGAGLLASRPRPWVVWPALGVLALLAWWEPKGSPKNGTVLIDTFHTRWSRTDRPYDGDWYGAASGYNYACFKRLYETFYDVRELGGRITSDELADASVLVIYVPDRSFAIEERRAIDDFVRRGGGLFLIGDHTNVFGSASHLNEVCRPFGFLFRDDVLFDLDADFFQLLDVPRLAPALLHGMSFLKLRGPASIRSTSPFTRSVLDVDHAKSFRAIYSVSNFYPPPRDHPRMHTGRFSISATSRHGKGRVVGFSDSTIFSNFEIFYPGKYEFLLNVAHWLNHEDALFSRWLRRGSLLAALLLLTYLLSRAHSPRNLLGVLCMALVVGGAGRLVSRVAEEARTGFPEPARPARSLFFVASAADPAYGLRAFTTDEPYDQRYDVFIQWVLRTGAFSGFHVTEAEHRNELFEMLNASDQVEAGLALVVRGPQQLQLLRALGDGALAECGRLLLMFSSTLSWEEVSGALAASGVVTADARLEEAAAGWPAGEALLDYEERKVLLVFSAERFSDAAMGYSEKVIPGDEQMTLYGEQFTLLERLFETETP